MTLATAPRTPTVGADTYTWGTVLNDLLSWILLNCTQREVDQYSSGPVTLNNSPGVDYIVLVSGLTQVNMPTAVDNDNLYTIKNTNSTVVNVTVGVSVNGQTIDGQTTFAVPKLASIDIVSDGVSAWYVI